jgi:hypothetical protein
MQRRSTHPFSSLGTFVFDICESRDRFEDVSGSSEEALHVFIFISENKNRPNAQGAATWNFHGTKERACFDKKHRARTGSHNRECTDALLLLEGRIYS